MMRLTGGLSEGQVLQRLGKRGAAAALAGTTAATGPVTATILAKDKPLPGWKGRAVGKAARGRFAATLAGIPAGGPYRLELRAGEERAAVREFFAGDVWILAGQSNMEGCGNRSGAARPHPLVRAFSMRRVWRRAEDPLHILAESPDACHVARPCSPARAERARRLHPKGVGPGLAFAVEMVRRAGVPQGLICAAHGGTSMAQWDPAKKREGGASLYGSMLLSARATGQPVAGLLWYQGESDANVADAPLYAGRMRKLVAASRRDLRQPGLPWVVVQIGRVVEPGTPERARAWNAVQEVQRLLPGTVRNLETVAAIDLPLDDHIHVGGAGPARLGVRLARAADRLVHGSRREAPAPALRSVGEARTIPEGGSTVIDVRFANVPGGLRAHGAPSGFALSDASGNDLLAVYNTTLHGDTARLYVRPGLTPGYGVSYGLGTAPVCTLADGRDMALPVFGPVATRPAAYLPFVTAWRTGGVVPAAAPLAELGAPELGNAPVKEYRDGLSGFVNEHDAWQGRAGHAFFAARMDLPEPMRLEMLAGYDGPFRLWIDRKPFFADLGGTNPCVADEGRKKLSLPAGRHDLHVAMDLNDGQAWGFMLRFRRLDVPLARMRSGDYAKPGYSA